MFKKKSDGLDLGPKPSYMSPYFIAMESRISVDKKLIKLSFCSSVVISPRLENFRKLCGLPYHTKTFWLSFKRKAFKILTCFNMK